MGEKGQLAMLTFFFFFLISLALMSLILVNSVDLKEFHLQTL